MAENQADVMLVTGAQLSEGYHEKRGQFIYARRFDVIRNNMDGTYIVAKPKVKADHV